MADFKPLDSSAGPIDLTVPIIKDNKTWEDLVEAFTYIMELNVEQPIQQLERIRYIDQDTEDATLESTARILGFDLSQDVLSLNSRTLLRLVTQLPLYPASNSSYLFENFIDVILNAITKVTYLYSRDYVNFFPEPGGTLITEGGEWFKTTHISLDIALIKKDVLVLKPGDTMNKRLVELFHVFAPIALVIEHLYLLEVIKDEDWMGGKAFAIGAHLDESGIERTVELT